MRLSLALISALVWVACSPSGRGVGPTLEDFAGFNMKSGFELAASQDTLLTRYGRGESLSRAEIAALRGNAWVSTAKHLAPGNLILRQWALIDLFTRAPAHSQKILEMMDLLTYGDSSEARLWAEGYGYWVYTRKALSPWATAFANEDAGRRAQALIDAVDRGFALTAYSRNGVWYPAPFGDLRDLPLQEPALSLRYRSARSGPVSCAFVNVASVAGGYRYEIRANPVGLNTHVPVDTQTVDVIAGYPVGFKFYEGYDKKYSGPEEERGDMLRPERVASIARLKLMERFRD